MKLDPKQPRFRQVCMLLFVFLIGPALASASTYWISPGGSDSNNGTSSSTAWLTPNHTGKLTCGDVIMAVPSSSYQYYNFNKGKWGQVSCPGTANVVWLTCQTFDGCKISSGGGMLVDQSYWGIQGWEVTATLAYSGCFAAAPDSYSGNATIHHIIFANNIAHGCISGGFISYNENATASVDYISIIGNIAYNGAQGSQECYSGISIYQPMNWDTADTHTHIYVAGNFSYGNLEPGTCAGGTAPGADGIIFDTFDGSQGKLPVYTATTLADNNILVSNNGNGFAVQNNYVRSPQGTNAPITVRHNTSWGNNVGTDTYSKVCSEILINSGREIQEYSNIAETNAATGCGGNPIYTLQVYQGDDTDYIASNIVYSPAGSGNLYYNYPTNDGFTFGSNTAENPDFTNATPPAAPSCSGSSNVPACMSYVVSDFTATNGSARYEGYQVPSNQSIHDPLYPQWMCNVTLPPDLVTPGCS